MKKFKPIEKLSAAEQVAEQIRKLIFSGDIKPGEKLPPERELASTFKVNRTTLRQALKKLEQLKLVFIRQGSGAEVLDYKRSSSLELLGDLLISGGGINERLLENILEARTIIGRESARLAASRRKRDELSELEKILAEMENAEIDSLRLQELDFRFFETIARASGNMVFIFFINAIREIYLSNMRYFSELIPSRAELLKSHKEIYGGIERGDGATTATATERFLSDGAKALLSRARILKPANAGALEPEGV